MNTKFENFLNQTNVGGYASTKIENVLFEISKPERSASPFYAISGIIVNETEFKNKYNKMSELYNVDYEGNLHSGDMYDEPKIPELIDVLADIEVMFYKYEKAMMDDDLTTALKYKEAILKIKVVTESI